MATLPIDILATKGAALLAKVYIFNFPTCYIQLPLGSNFLSYVELQVCLGHGATSIGLKGGQFGPSGSGGGSQG